MQKTVRINLLARNSAARHFQKIKHRDTKAEWKLWHAGTNRIKAAEGSTRAEERKHRRQDWMAGPLAPNRNSGLEKGVYGTLTMDVAQTPDIPESVRAGPEKVGYAAISEEEQAEKGFRGDTIVGNVVEHDRVVIFAGPERLRGLIGHVNSVDLLKEEVKLTNINSVDVRIPAYAQPPANPDDPTPAKYSSVDLSIPMSHIRLVGEMEDDSGQLRDVIIRHVHAGAPYQQRPKGSNLPAHTRYITGGAGNAPLELPWPEEVIEDDSNHCEGDTTRTTVQAPTWEPPLIDSPLGYTNKVPASVSSNTNPYSRTPELLTIDTQGTAGLSNIQRAGLSGFISDDKLVARQKRIADGIMNEFRTKHRELNVRHDDTQWVKRKMIEDARSIWYRDRKLDSPTAQAAELAVQRRAAQREEIMAQEREKVEEITGMVKEVRLSAARSERTEERRAVRGGSLFPPEVFKNLGFLPDRKMRKKLRSEKVRERGLKVGEGQGKQEGLVTV